MGLTDVASVLALAISIGTAGYTGFAARRVSQREVTAQIIADYYASLRDLSTLQLQEWRLSHLFEVAENYGEIVGLLQSVAPPVDDLAGVELRLKERAAAITVFGLYEHVIYQLREADAARDEARRHFLEEAADYFVSRLLVNPRLRYLWARDGGNLQCEFEESARIHYGASVSEANESWDSHGPYANVDESGSG